MAFEPLIPSWSSLDGGDRARREGRSLVEVRATVAAARVSLTAVRIIIVVADCLEKFALCEKEHPKPQRMQGEVLGCG